MAYGKSIELFLVNGTADSLITAELSNWNGKAIKIPASKWLHAVVLIFPKQESISCFVKRTMVRIPFILARQKM